MIANILTLLSMLDPTVVKPLLKILESPETVALFKTTINMFVDSSGRFDKGKLKKELDEIKSTSAYKW